MPAMRQSSCMGLGAGRPPFVFGSKRPKDIIQSTRQQTCRFLKARSLSNRSDSGAFACHNLGARLQWFTPIALSGIFGVNGTDQTFRYARSAVDVFGSVDGEEVGTFIASAGQSSPQPEYLQPMRDSVTAKVMDSAVLSVEAGRDQPG